MFLYLAGLLLSVYVIYYIYDWWSRQAWVDGLHRKAVLITGCDSGFGNATAKSLYKLGVYVYAGCYTQSGATTLQEETGERLKTVLLDVTKTDSIQQAYRTVVDTLPSGVEFWGLVNNAGIAGGYDVLESCSMDYFRSVFNVNLFGVIEMTKTFLPLLKKSCGRVVNTASVMADIIGPELLPYIASKWAVKGFSESFRVQKAVWGIKVSTIQPGGFKTEITNTEVPVKQMRESWSQLEPHIQQQYGQDYLDNMIIRYQSMMSEHTYSDISPVVSAYQHALFAVHPYNVYRPGSGMLMYIMYIPSFLVEKFILAVPVPAIMRH